MSLTLSPVQLAWLQEIGLDKRMLAFYETDAGPFVSAPPATSHDSAGALRVPGGAASAGIGSAASGVGAGKADIAAMESADAAAAHPAGGAGSRAARKTENSPGSGTAMREGLRPAPTAEALALLVGAHGREKGAAGPLKRAGVNGPGNAAALQSAAPPAQRGPIPDTLSALAPHIYACQACGLHASRSQAVPGAGHADAPAWMVIGEAPGNRDDREGLPFQGKSGALLQAMFASIGIGADAPVFYTNIVKCRPLGNRPPSAEEIAACKPYLERQIALIRPARILALGTQAAQALLGTEEDIDTLRGAVRHVRSEDGADIPVVVTYHPTALLLRPQHKADAWADLNVARTLLR
ncbi:uracil-DNA glycosylase [Pusillimonas sp. TS35]|uniref:uracil-DNA glycosylase n=1 Tax=Paracandidimonas lactea TaxID=2895524 RepID=UPI00136FC135|nr:uracil-DNA glycosylase [Paracandidimonas lactea]MYN13658.1 uracil-DNA glycosylase [Pusillimonas sp. TS35]